MDARMLLSAMKDLAATRREGGSVFECLSLEDVCALSAGFGGSPKEVSRLALENGFVPLRYLRNMGTVGPGGQARLLGSKVVVVGAGGLGGRAAELLARMGVGTLTLVDPDVFDETNLNRQGFSSEDVLGRSKVEVVLERIREINGDVTVDAVLGSAGPASLPGLLDGADAAVDALDTMDDRVVLQEACRASGVVMVHAAIAGTCLQVTTVYPGDPGIEPLYAAARGGGPRGIEVETGNPAATPAAAAAIQAHEVIKVILGTGEPLRGRLLYVDLDDWSVEFLDL